MSKQLKLSDYKSKPKEAWEKYVQPGDSEEIQQTAQAIFGVANKDDNRKS